MVLQVLLAALGTGVGAFVAFRLQRSSAQQNIYRKDVVQGNRLLFTLGYRVTELIKCKEASMVKEHRNYPNYVKYKPLIMVPLRSYFSDIEIPDRLIEGNGKAVGNIQYIASYHDTCIALFEIHNTNYEKTVQGMMTKLNVGVSGITSFKDFEEQLKINSAKDYVELKDTADHLSRNLDNGILNSIQYLKEIRASLQKEYSDGKFVDFNFEVLLQDIDFDLKEEN